MSRFEYTIENVLDIPLWEKMQDRLAELTGTAIVCIDIKGKPVTKHSGRTAFCSIVRENPVSRKRCFRCDALAGVEAVRRGRPYIYLCHCGIVDVAVPVMVGDIYLGAVMFGQVRLRHKDQEKAERLVNEISSILPQEDAAQQEILRKYELLPEMDYDRIVQVAEYINDMVHYIVDRAVKSHTRDETYKWLMSANAEQSSEEIQIQELLPQEEHRPQQTGVLPVNPSSVVYPAVVYIRDHLQQEITMKEMADLCHLSPSYFSRTFNKETGESFVNYISSRRIQLAKELLLETGKSISQIAEEVGLTTSATLQRCSNARKESPLPSTGRRKNEKNFHNSGHCFPKKHRIGAAAQNHVLQPLCSVLTITAALICGSYFVYKRKRQKANK